MPRTVDLCTRPPLPRWHSGECPEFMGSWKVNIPTDPFSFRPNGYHFWKRDIISGCSSIRVVKAKMGWKIPVVLTGCPFILLRALDARDQRER